MGNGFFILIWDSWGAGLVRVNPRLLSIGKDLYGNPRNWFPYKTNKEKEDMVMEMTKNLEYYDVFE